MNQIRSDRTKRVGKRDRSARRNRLFDGRLSHTLQEIRPPCRARIRGRVRRCQWTAWPRTKAACSATVGIFEEIRK